MKKFSPLSLITVSTIMLSSANAQTVTSLPMIVAKAGTVADIQILTRVAYPAMRLSFEKDLPIEIAKSECILEQNPKSIQILTGSFTKPKAQQRAIFYRVCSSRVYGFTSGLLIVESQRPIAHYLISGSSTGLLGTADLNKNGTSEILLNTLFMGNGEVTERLQPVDFNNGKPTSFGILNLSFSLCATVVPNSYSDDRKLFVRAGNPPQFYQEIYRTLCGGNAKAKLILKRSIVKFEKPLQQITALGFLKENATSAPTPAPPVTQTPVNKAPLITAFAATPNPAFVGSEVAFNWQINDPENEALTCQLDTDNNGTFEYTVPNCSSSSVQKHKYAKEGLYTARLQVRDSKNASVNQTLTMTVNIPETTVTVNTFEDSQDAAAGDGNCLDNDGKCSLRAAIMEANADLSRYYKIKLDEGTYNLSIRGDEQEARAGDLNIVTNIRIHGVSPEKTKIQLADFGFVTLAGNKRVEMNNFTLTGGTNVLQGEGSVSMNRVNLENGKNLGSMTSLEVQNSVWKDFSGEGLSGNTASLTNVEIQNLQFDGMLKMQAGIKLSGVRIENSTGAITSEIYLSIDGLNAKYFKSYLSSIDVVITNSTIVMSSHQNGNKDGCFVESKRLMTVSKSEFVGGYSSLCANSLTFSNSKQMYNKGLIRATVAGIRESYLFGNFNGGIQVDNLIMQDTVVRKMVGAGVITQNAKITNSLVDANGFGIQQGNGNLEISSSIISNNRNGGIRLDDSSKAIIKNSVIAGNTAARGAGIDGGQKVTIIHSTIFGNRAEVGFIDEGSQNDQTKTIGQGGGFYATGVVELRGTVLTDNTSSINRGPNCAGNPPKSLGYNLIRNTTDCGFAVSRNSAGQVTDIVAQDAKLIALTLANPNPMLDSALQILPDTTSSLINRVPAEECSDVISDVIGRKRIGNCDIGAVERPEISGSVTESWLSSSALVVAASPTKLLKNYEKIGIRCNIGGISLAFSQANNILAVSSGGSVLLVDYSTCKVIKVIRAFEYDIVAMSFNLDGKTLAIGGDNDSVFFFDTSNSQLISQINNSFRRVYSLIFSPDGKIVAITDLEGITTLRDILTGKEIVRFKSSGSRDNCANYFYCSISFDPTGQVLAIPTENDTVSLWNISKNEKIKEFQGSYGISFSPDGKMVASGTQDTNKTYLWNISSGVKEQTFELIGKTAFSPDGKIIAISSESTVRLFNLRDGAQISQYDGYTGSGYRDPLNPVVFSRDGRYLATVEGIYSSPDDDSIFNSQIISNLTSRFPSQNYLSFLLPPLLNQTLHR